MNRRDAPVVTASIDEDGTYRATTLVGQNVVSLSGPQIARDPNLSYYAETVVVQEGDNEFDISLP